MSRPESPSTKRSGLFRSRPHGARRAARPFGPGLVESLEERQLLTGTPELLFDFSKGVAAPAQFTSVEKITYFTADDGSTGVELWRTDGTPEGTRVVADLAKGSASSNPANLTLVSDKLFFTANDGKSGVELWWTDGEKTALVSDIAPGLASSNPANLTVLDGKVYFTADDGKNGGQLYVTDGEKTTQVNATPFKVAPTELTVAGKTLFFAASDGSSGNELWKSDGTPEGTRLVRDIRKGAASANPASLAAAGKVVYFSANDGSSGNEIWKSDGTEAGTVLVKEFKAGASSAPSNIVTVGDITFFTADDGASGLELWRTDGTTAGTRLVRDITVGNSGSNPANLIAKDNTLYFTANDSKTGVELWKSDGTEAGTVLVRDLAPGSDSSNPTNLTVVNGFLTFTASDGKSPYQLWQTDGTAEGSELVQDYSKSTDGAGPASLTAAPDAVYYSASDGSTGRSLFRLGVLPIGVALTGNTVAENQPAGTTVGTLGAVNGNAGSNWTYSLVAGAGSTDNASFTTVGNQLRTAASFDFETKSSYSVRVRATNPGGQISEQTFTIGVLDVAEAPATTVLVHDLVDATTPQAGSVQPGGHTNDTQPIMIGVLSTPLTAGQSIRVYNNGTQIGVGTPYNTNQWYYWPTTPLADGTYNLTIRVVDAGGLLGPASPVRSFTVDTVTSAITTTISGVSDNVTPVTGSVPNGGFTNDATPTLTGTISSALAANDQVGIYDGAVRIGTAVVSGLSWSFTPATAIADGLKNLTARVVDLAGNLSAASSLYVITVDTVTPDTWATVGGVLTPTGPVANAVTNSTTPTLVGAVGPAGAGSAPNANETLYVYDNGVLLGAAVVTVVPGGQSTWSYTPTTPLAVGSHSITVKMGDAAGNLGMASLPVGFTIDLTTPTTTLVVNDLVDSVGTVQGSVANGGVTNDAQAILLGTLSAPLAAGETVRVFNNGVQIGTATVYNSTSWYFWPSTPLAQGTYNLTLRVASAGGNLGPVSTTRTFTVDTVAPTAVAAIASVVAPTGTVSDGGTTSSTTPTFTGTLGGPTAGAALAAGDRIEVRDGTTLLGLATVTVVPGGQSIWSFTPTTALAMGSHSITVRMSDAAGNGTTSAARTFTIAPAAPTTTVTINRLVDGAGSVQGDIANGGVTNDVQAMLLGTLSAPLTAGETLQVFNNGVFLGFASVYNSTSWYFWPGTPLTNGLYNLTLRVASSTGILGAVSSTFSFTVNTALPG